MRLIRHNAWCEIEGAPKHFLDKLQRHLAVPVAPTQKAGERFGKIFWAEGEPWGSMLVDRRVPAGLVPHVIALAKFYNVPGVLRDARTVPEVCAPFYCVNAPWRPYQDRVQDAVMHNPVGVIDAPPRSGKTLMMARLIDTRGVPTLCLAPSVQIVRQTHEVLVSHFGASMVARFDGDAEESDRDLSRPIVVATAQSAVKLPKSFYDTRDMLITDEWHHAAAETHHRINDLADNVYYRYGFTGTHFRSGEDSLAMDALCSETIAQVPLEELIPNYLAPPRVFFLPVTGRIQAQGWDEAYDEGILNHENRNALIVKVATSMQRAEIPTIVLTRRRAHADALGAAISGSVVVKGGENVLTGKAVRDFLAGRYSTMIGTTVIGEGVDVPRAAALIYASGGNDGVSMMQSYYRPLTAHAGKDAGRIYDFWDKHHSTLRSQSVRRLGMAQKSFGEQRVFRTE